MMTLAEAFQFTEEDLEQNRKGKLSDAQTEHLKKDGKEYFSCGLWLLLVAAIITIALSLIHIALGLFVGLLIFIVGIMGVLKNMQAYEIINQGVQPITGEIELGITTEPFLSLVNGRNSPPIPVYYVRIEDHRFNIRFSQFRALKDGYKYTIYFFHDKIFSLELLPGQIESVVVTKPIEFLTSTVNQTTEMTEAPQSTQTTPDPSQTHQVSTKYNEHNRELRELLKFSAADLEENHEGHLSARQLKVVEATYNYREQYGLFTITIFFIMVILMLTCFSIPQMSQGTLVVCVPYILALVFFIYAAWEDATTKDEPDTTLRHVEGEISISIAPNNISYIKVQDKFFDIKNDAVARIKSGDIYRVYYVGESKLVSIEWLGSS